MSGAPTERDRGSISVVMMLLLVIVLGGAGLIVDGGRAMTARRHAANTAEAAARGLAVSTVTPVSGFDPTRARAAAFSYATRAGVAARDVKVVVGADFVTVTVTERRNTVFLILGGQSTMTVTASGTARVVYSD